MSLTKYAQSEGNYLSLHPEFHIAELFPDGFYLPSYNHHSVIRLILEVVVCEDSS